MEAIVVISLLGLAVYVLVIKPSQQQDDLGFGSNSVLEDIGASVGATDAMSQAVTLIKGFEGFSATPYPDAGGYSVGYGHYLGTSPDAYANGISESDASDLLLADLQSFADCVDSAVTVDLNTNQRAALYSFTYNVGCAAFQNSTLLRKLNQGDYDGAAAELSKWNRSQGTVNSGLVSRRQQEQSVFNG